MCDITDRLNLISILYKDEKVWESHVLLQKLIKEYGFKDIYKLFPICIEIQRRAAILKQFVDVLNDMKIDEIKVSSDFYTLNNCFVDKLTSEYEQNVYLDRSEFYSCNGSENSDSYNSLNNINDEYNSDLDDYIEDKYFDVNGNLLNDAQLEECKSLVTNTKPKGWVCVTKKESFDLWYRGYEDSTIVEICFQGSIKTNIFNVLSVFYERDLYKEWIPYFSFPVKFGLNSIKEIIHRDRVHIVTAIYIDIPWPFSNREVILEIWVSDEITQNNRIFIHASSIENHGFHPRLKTDIPYLMDYSNRANISGGGFVSPVDDCSTCILFMWKIDLLIDPPKFLLNFFLKVFIKACWEKFCKTCIQADGPNSIHRERINNNKELYDFIRERISARKYIEKTKEI
ncbi:hypothetical protein FG386_000242 [Cryptosporidium ryanae]|uniref:uncharacterized protein n=1 Tax=Cryptosporidium ryanae TaxID=515981 RepID=UPI00351A82FE|nr:hypothetical protein FG386_000242 [Cryptosporidium ryanae]